MAKNKVLTLVKKKGVYQRGSKARRAYSSTKQAFGMAGKHIKLNKKTYAIWGATAALYGGINIWARKKQPKKRR